MKFTPDLDPIFRARIENERIVLQPDEIGQMAEYRRLLNEMEIEIIVRRFVPRRSVGILKYYWKLLGLVAEKTGHSKEEIHGEFKIRHGFDSISDSNSEETAEYLEAVRADAAELRVYMPDRELVIE